jgi:hypothetical protein
VSRSVLFAGVTIVRPGAFTSIDASQFQNIARVGIGTIGLIGEAAGGTAAPRTVNTFFAPEDVEKAYGSGDIVEAAFMAANPSADPLIAAGAQAYVCYMVNNATQASLSWSSIHDFVSKQYGLNANLITVNIATDGGSGRIVTVTRPNQDGTSSQEISPDLGTTGKMIIQYIGAGSAATLTTTATTFVTTVTGAAGDDLNLTYSSFASLGAMLAYIASLGTYTVSSLIANTNFFDPSNLDAVTAIDIKTAPTTLYARNFDVADWINSNSQIITDTLTKGHAGPTPTLVTTPLSGGTLGSADNTAWSNGLLAMRGVRVNQLVPLASADGTGSDTWTVASVLAAVAAHLKFVSSTAGRNECQGFAGFHGSKTALVTQQLALNSPDMSLGGQQPKLRRTSDGVITFFPEWALAACTAGMRCGAPLGEPLTFKFINVMGLQSDASWAETNNSDVEFFELNGIYVVNSVYGRGFRIDKMITTYTASDNDAFTEETVVQNWKLVAFTLRQALENAFVGRPGTLNRVSEVPTIVQRALQPIKDAGAITDSLVNGVTLNAWRNVKWSLNGDVLTVSLIVTPTPGINFVLTTLILVPAQISGAAA